MPQLILTALGNDRPGLGGELTGLLLQGGLLLEDLGKLLVAGNPAEIFDDGRAGTRREWGIATGGARLTVAVRLVELQNQEQT